MKIYEGAIIVWTDKENKIFNDVKKADDYFNKMKKFNPEWQRVFEPIPDWVKNKSQYRKTKRG